MKTTHVAAVLAVVFASPAFTKYDPSKPVDVCVSQGMGNCQLVLECNSAGSVDNTPACTLSLYDYKCEVMVFLDAATIDSHVVKHAFPFNIESSLLYPIIVTKIYGDKIGGSILNFKYGPFDLPRGRGSQGRYNIVAQEACVQKAGSFACGINRVAFECATKGAVPPPPPPPSTRPPGLVLPPGATAVVVSAH